MATQKTEGLTIITGRVILSYPVFAEPRQDTDDDGKPTGKAKFSGTFIFLPGSDLSAAKKAALAAAEVKWPGKVQEMLAASRKSVAEGGSLTFRMPFRTDVSSKGYPEGSTFINARSERRPGLAYATGANGKPDLVPLDKITEVFYPGAIVRASLTFFAYDRKGNRGVAAGLNNVQKLADGERLDNRVAADQEFDIDLSATPADLAALVG
jgi:hypothetical protein